MMWFAFLVDAAVYALLGSLAYWLGRRRLPAPWNSASVIIPAVVGVGLLLSLATYPHWLVNS